MTFSDIERGIKDVSFTFLLCPFDKVTTIYISHVSTHFSFHIFK